MPLVQFRLQPITLGEQCAVLRREVVDEGIEAFPERFAIDANARQRFFIDVLAELGCNLQSVSLDHLTHG
jgi:hypothetical protein